MATDYVGLGTMLATLIAAITAAVVAVIAAISNALKQRALAKIMVDAAARADAAANAAASRVATVKADLLVADKKTDAKLDAITELGVKTHALVNSAMGAQLKLTAETARAKAEITHDPVDETAAAVAEALLAQHQGRQARADAGSPKPEGDES